MKLACVLCLSLLLCSCGSGPGVAPEPPNSAQHYNGDLPTGTANTLYRH